MHTSDIAIIGAGVVGLALAVELSTRFPHAAITLFERHDTFGRETSSRNSEVIHAGIYYPAGSLKASLCVDGRRQLYALAESHGIPYRKCGKVIVAACDSEVESLHQLKAKGEANGVEGLQLLTQDEVAAREPHVTAVAGLYSPETGLLQPARYSAGDASARLALWVARVVEHTPARLQHAECLAVEGQRIQLSGETECRRVMDDTRERAGFELCELLKAVADGLLDDRVIEQRL